MKRSNLTTQPTRRKTEEAKRLERGQSDAVFCCAAVEAFELPPAALPKYFESSRNVSTAENQKPRQQLPAEETRARVLIFNASEHQQLV